MSAKNNKNEMHNDSTGPFIQEKILPKKKLKLKKIILATTTTTMLAILFGFVGRLVFDASEPLVCRLLGHNQKVTFPSKSVETLNSQKNVTPNPSNIDKIDEQAPSTKKPESTVIIKQELVTDLKDYERMYSLIKDLVKDANQSIVTVSGVKSGVDWFNNTYNTSDVTSGLIIANNGEELLILTSKDKIVDANNITVTFSGNLTVSANIIGADADTGLAVVSTSLENIPDNVLNKTKVATLGESYLMERGDAVIAIGSPNGYIYSLGLGMITNMSNYVNITDNKLELFNTDLVDNPNSEGVIINLKGEVIGVITQKYKEDLNKGINTVIAISKAKSIIESLANQEERVYFGIVASDLTTESAKNLKVKQGIYVTEVEVDSPAYHASLQNGDVILTIDDIAVTSVSFLNDILSNYKPQENIHVKIQTKSGKEKLLKVVLGKKGKKY